MLTRDPFITGESSQDAAQHLLEDLSEITCKPQCFVCLCAVCLNVYLKKQAGVLRHWLSSFMGIFILEDAFTLKETSTSARCGSGGQVNLIKEQ